MPLGRDVAEPRPVQAVAFATRRHESGIAWVVGAGHEKSDDATPPPQACHRLRDDAGILVWAEGAEYEDRLLGRFVGTLWFVIGAVRDVANVARPMSLHQVTAIVAERDHHQIGPQDQPGRERQAEAKGAGAKSERGEIRESRQFVKRHDGAIPEHAGAKGGDEAAGGGR